MTKGNYSNPCPIIWLIFFTITFTPSCSIFEKINDCIRPQPIADTALNWCSTVYENYPRSYNAPVQYGSEENREVKWIIPEDSEFLGFGKNADGTDNQEMATVNYKKIGTYQLCVTTLNKCGENTPTCQLVKVVPRKNEVHMYYDDVLGRLSAAGGFANGKIYYGLGGLGKSFYDWYSYDLQKNQFIAQASFPSSEKFDYLGSASINDKIYVMTNYGRLFEYNALSNAWTFISNFPGGERTDFSMYSLNGKVYITGGRYTHKIYREHWSFNPASGAWEQKADYPSFAFYDGVAMQAGDVAIVAGGFIDQSTSFGSETGNNHNECWSYNPQTDQWKKIGLFQSLAIGIYVKDNVAILKTKRGLIKVGSSLESYAQTDEFECVRDISSHGLHPVNIIAPSLGISILIGGRAFADQGEGYSISPSYGFTFFYN